MSPDSTVPDGTVTPRPMPGDSIVCKLATEPTTFKALLIAHTCFYKRGQACRRYSAVVRDVRRVLDQVDTDQGARPDPRNHAIARGWVDDALNDPGSPLRVLPRWMRYA